MALRYKEQHLKTSGAKIEIISHLKKIAVKSILNTVAGESCQIII